MKQLLRLCYLLLTICAMLTPAADAAPGKGEQIKRRIPTQIEALRKQKNHILNVGKYDKNALVYYVYHIDLSYGSSAFNEENFKDNTEFLALAYKKIYRKGAELIMHLNYSDEDAANFERYKKRKYYGHLLDIPKLARRCSLKCPIVNSYKRKVRQTFFQDSTSEYANERFQAIDYNGNVLAYFSRMNDSIVMYDEEMNTRKVLLSSGFNSGEWEAAAIAASFEELVSRMQRKELAARARARTDEKAAEKAKKKPKASKAKKKAKNKNKPARKRPSRDEEEEDDDFTDEEEDDFAADDDSSDEYEEEDDDDFLSDEDE